MFRMDRAMMTREFPNTARTLHRHIPRTKMPSEPSDGDVPPRIDSGLRAGGRHVGPNPRPNRGSGRLRASIRRFRRSEHGGVAIESAVAIMVLVVGFAGLMEIVQVVYTDDRMSHAARAAARDLALNPSADACATIRRELGLPEDFDCGTEWTLKVDRGVSPRTLPDTFDDSVAPGTGDMVLVRIGPPSGENSEEGTGDEEEGTGDEEEGTGDEEEGTGDEEEGTGDEEEGTGDEDADGPTVSDFALGLARCEIELCGQAAS